jgi:CRP-like cAMP-binding protein
MQPRSTNHMLETLGEGDGASLWRELVPVELTLGDVLIEAGARTRYAYFPVGAVVSLVAVLGSGDQNEAGIIGRNGVVGSLAVLSDELVSPWRAVVQIEGDALQIEINALKACMRQTDRLDRIVQRATVGTLRMTAQTAACTRFHVVTARCARWLLTLADEAGTNVFPMTHELLATTMGVDRATVSVAAGTLQNTGLIRYRRGVIEVIDRAGLEALTCECYAFIRGQHDWTVSA